MTFDLEGYYHFYKSFLSLSSNINTLYATMIDEYTTSIKKLNEPSTEAAIASSLQEGNDIEMNADPSMDMNFDIGVLDELEDEDEPSLLTSTDKMEKSFLQEEEGIKEEKPVEYTYTTLFALLEDLLHIYQQMFPDVQNYFYINHKHITSLISTYISMKNGERKDAFVSEEPKVIQSIQCLLSVLYLLEKDSNNLYHYVKEVKIENNSLYVILSFLFYIPQNEENQPLYNMIIQLITVLLNVYIYTLIDEADCSRTV